MLSLSIPAVKSRLHRARASLRRLLDKQLGQHQALEPTCTRVVDLFLQNLEEDIDANLCASMKSHVASCPQCKAECDRLHVLLAQCSDLQQVEVPRQLQDEIRQAIAKLRGSTTAKLIDATNDGN